MPIKTNLNQYPYWDDYDQTKDFYRILYKPGVSVQMRELNQMQTLVQAQIERFGDNIFTHGTIVSGCNFRFYTPYPYIKLPDTQTDGSLTVPSNYLGKFIVDNASGLKAYVVNWVDGYELSPPDLKTLYIQYIDSGTAGNTTTFVPGNNITIYDGSYPVSEISVVAGGSGFSNTDQLVINPAMLINVATGVFTASDYLTNPLTDANVEIVSANTTAVPGKTLVTIKPRDVDLTNASVNSIAWTFQLYDNITNPTGTAVGVIEQIYGADAQGRIVTNSLGTVQEVSMTSGGKNYTYTPTATVKTSNVSVITSNLILNPKNFVATCRIPSNADAVGNGYAFGISEGIIYQKGYFLRVATQTAVVSKYNSTPNNVVVGFSTLESIVTATEDETLYENALGTPNEFAPGADRLKLVPELILASKEAAVANAEFFALVEWNDGYPSIQNRSTSYSRIGDFIAADIYDSSGNFVLDAFQVTTESVANSDLEGKYFTITVDPGQGYINGKKVQTLSNYKIDMIKGLDTKTSNNMISLNYGNYIRINQLGGQLDFSAGAQIDLYDQPAGFMSNTSTLSAGTIAPLGKKIGTSRIRSLEIESGYPGTISAVYKLYLFDTQMNAGENFKQTKAIYYNGATFDGIADVVQTFDATTSSNITQIQDITENSLLFPAGVESLKSTANSSYVYRTTEVVNTVVNTAELTITLTDPNEYFPWEGDLSATEMGDLIVVPVEAAIKCANHAGTVAGNTTVTTVTGSGTDFSSIYMAGDYIEVTDGSSNVAMKRVTGVVNSTSLVVDSVFGFTASGLAHRRVFPKNIPVPFGQRPGLYANVDGTGKVLTLEYRFSNSTPMTLFHGDAEVDTQISYNVSRRGASSATKQANRNKYVKICLANNVGGLQGPWCIGVPDAFRMRAVYVGNSTVNASSSDVTSSFYIDHNQNANYMGLGYLYLRPKTSITLAPTDYLLVCFDYFTRDNAGYYDTVSYLRTSNTEQIAILDSMTFDELSVSSNAASWEVPEVYTTDGIYYDLYRTLDFRPTAANTAAPSASPATAPINPSETVTLAAHSKFPKPNAILNTTIEQYLGRVDDVYIAQSGRIYVLKGIPDINPRNRYQSNHPKGSLRLQTLVVPPYPNITTNVQRRVNVIAETGIGNEKFMRKRIQNHTIIPFLNTTNLQTSQPMVYTMEDIATLERRIADLEYYVALSLMETNLTNRIIPSSVNPALDRFKFGFFADDFSTLLYSDLENPQYNASIEAEGAGDISWGAPGNPLSNNAQSPLETEAVAGSWGNPALKTTFRLVPPKRVWSLKHFTENIFYVDHSIISQRNATDKPAAEELNPCVVTGTVNTGFTAYDYYLAVNRAQSTVYIDSETGTANVYFDIRAGAAQGFGGKITVYDANNTIVASTDWARNGQKLLGPNDKVFLSTNPNANSWYRALSPTDFTKAFTRLTGNLQDYGKGVGKLPISVPLGGGRFLIKVESNDETLSMISWKLLVEFPSLITAPGYTINTADCSPKPPSWQGSLEAGTLTMTEWSCSNIFRTFATGYKAFVLVGTGLKASTVHNLYVDGVDWGQYTNAMKSGDADRPYVFRIRSASVNGTWFFDCKYDDTGGTTGDPLKTNASGQIAMIAFFPLDLAGWFSQDFNAVSYTYGGSDKGFIQTTYTSGGVLTPTYGSSGYSSIVLKDSTGQSIASRVFANRTPNKTIPYDPRGSI